MCWWECLWYINPIRVWQPRLFFLQFRWWWWWWRSWPGFCICCPSGWCLLLLLLQISLWGSETLFLRSVVLQTPARSSTASCSTRAAPALASTSTPSSRKTQVRCSYMTVTALHTIQIDSSMMQTSSHMKQIQFLHSLRCSFRNKPDL